MSRFIIVLFIILLACGKSSEAIPTPTPTLTLSPSPVVVEEEEFEGPTVIFMVVVGGFLPILVEPVDIYEIVHQEVVLINGFLLSRKLTIQRRDGVEYVLLDTNFIPGRTVLVPRWSVSGKLASVGPLEEGDNGVSWNGQSDMH